MSEIIQTEQVDIEESTQNQDSVTLADILSGIGWIGIQSSRLAYKGGLAGIKLATHAAQAAKNSYHTPLTYSEAHKITEQAPNASDAIRSLSNYPGFHFSQTEAEPLKLHLQRLVQEKDIKGVHALSQSLIHRRQTKTQTSVLEAASESLCQIGFSPHVLKSGDGLISGKSRCGHKKITLAVEKSRDGGLRMHLDADGFNGVGCTETLNNLQAEMRKRGVRFLVNSRTRKDRSPAIDARRLPQNVKTRRAR